MMRTAQLMVFLFACGVLLAPLATVVHACDEDGGDPCCSAGCVLCLCCAHQPPLASATQALLAGVATGPLNAATAGAAVNEDPRDIFHVPIAAPSR